ncbi:phosphotyrosine-protein phosphatase [Liquorilactobacillus aquaticus DSM 21051]|uniref:Tyrosine-protein phosphatase n=1 Tax=Liquorilactobacillus aquaticus DSM 21051 TaxID=1423725 RepID=A0A0R2D461_9LACO|nr:CpsB/CapC family capsule biosynthesis tyrosine phosphatase [Liquorilactobacillus aquaticus]KRM95142.1 phosphotyrosine-protein phosphatase [Liquorilactobacillus aquaticus DSM 21051]
MEKITASGKIVDLHCHLLPSIDDGSPDLEHSISLANDAVEEGITHILATPHHLDGDYVNHRDDVIKSVTVFQNELNIRKIPLTIFPGQEVHINGDLIERYDDLLGVDEAKKYMLIEFPHGSVPAYAKRLFFELRKIGTTPIIVHPERNREIQNNLNILYEFISEGALAQLTATSYIGGFGENVKKISDQLVSHGLVQLFASDAHALKGRKFALREAFEELKGTMGQLKVDEFEQNAENLLNGLPVMAHGYSQIIEKKKRFFFF